MYLARKNIQTKYQYVPDVFYLVDNLTPNMIKNILTEANKIALFLDISYLSSENIVHRKNAEKEKLENLLPLITKKQVDFFRLIIRKNFNWYMILKDTSHIEDIIEICVRNIIKEDKEYFISCYVQVKHFERFKKKYKLGKLL